MSGPHPYAGRTAMLLTLHGKEQVIAPRFAETLGVAVETDRSFDTDSLGTFTRDGSRRGVARRMGSLAGHRSTIEMAANAASQS